MLVVNDIAPDFTLKDKDSKDHSLSKVKTKYTLVYFYPRDNTPGCSIEAHNLNKNLKKFQELDTTIIGISGGNAASKSKFCTKYDLEITLLSDPDFKISTLYGTYGKKKFMGKEYMGISRQSFLLDQNKKVIKVYAKVKPLNHANELIEDIMSLNK